MATGGDGHGVCVNAHLHPRGLAMPHAAQRVRACRRGIEHTVCCWVEH